MVAYNILEDEVRKYYPDCKVLYKWNTEDCITLDKIPYIGEFSHFMPNMYISTGFNKWGMTSSNVAANIIVDKILGRENEYEDVFKATRLHPIKNNAELGNMIKETANSLVINKFKVVEIGYDEDDFRDVGDVGVSGFEDDNGDIGYDGGLGESALRNYGLSVDEENNGDLGKATLSNGKQKDDGGSDVDTLGEDGSDDGKSGKFSSGEVDSDDIGGSKKDSSNSDKEYVVGNQKYSNKDDAEVENDPGFSVNKNEYNTGYAGCQSVCYRFRVKSRAGSQKKRQDTGSAEIQDLPQQRKAQGYLCHAKRRQPIHNHILETERNNQSLR